jgi:(p)ppGpp synthase/HD superfamily hydrolase
MIDLVDRAIEFAAKAHNGQVRKIGGAPYISHPAAVGMLLQRMGCEPAVVAAGLLHDTVEDTSITLELIRAKFGDEVASIVAGCTELPKPRNHWEARKLHMIASLRDASLAVKLVSAADKYHNLSHILYAEREQGPDIWKKFRRGKEQQAWYYRSVMGSLLANVEGLERYPLFAMLAELIDELFAGVTAQPPE